MVDLLKVQDLSTGLRHLGCEMADGRFQAASILAQIIYVCLQMTDLIRPTIKIPVEIDDLSLQGRDLGCKRRRLQTDNTIGLQGRLEGITLLSEAVNLSPVAPDLSTLSGTHHLERLEGADMLTVQIRGFIRSTSGLPELIA
ncbi:Hypothetical protein PHPALM_1880 [Phytophthora palmivora]|uniref:Uncharacterized protein n=1 Tax=Phytophthora palmivora TaxID=4796 RepID=A0A2P4YR68_9STRA|nr:Hypothetical protein PHPALM_1880 [Phytophthora palmivora]